MIPAKPTLRRITWCRVHHELLHLDLWALVADMAKVDLALVEAFVVRLEIHASASMHRGHVEDFNIAALAAKWRRGKDELARIYAALEHPDVGWIDQDQIVSFWARNPDLEDPTAAERQRNKRARDKAAKADARMARQGLSTVTRDSRDVTRDSVTVTTRSDQIKKKEGLGEEGSSGAADSVHTRSGESGDFDLWLMSGGCRIVVECLEVQAPSAQVRIARWKKTLGDDDAAARALVKIIQAAEATNLRGARFHNLISDQVTRHRLQLEGPQLPLMPPRPKGRAHG